MPEPDPVLLEQTERVHRALVKSYAGRTFSLLGAQLSAQEALSPARGLPVVVAASRELFCIAHPEKNMDGLFPFELEPVESGNPAGGQFGFRLCLRDRPASPMIGMIFMDSAIRRAEALTPTPGMIDLDQISPSLYTYIKFLERQEPAPATSPGQ